MPAGRYCRPGVDFRAGRVAQRKAQPRHIHRQRRGARDLALDHEHRHAVMGLVGNGDVLEHQPAQVHRQSDRGIERCHLRGAAHDVLAPGEQCRHHRHQHQDQRRQPALRCLAPPARGLPRAAPHGGTFDIFGAVLDDSGLVGRRHQRGRLRRRYGDVRQRGRRLRLRLVRNRIGFGRERGLGCRFGSGWLFAGGKRAGTWAGRRIVLRRCWAGVRAVRLFDRRGRGRVGGHGHLRGRIVFVRTRGGADLVPECGFFPGRGLGRGQRGREARRRCCQGRGVSGRRREPLLPAPDAAHGPPAHADDVGVHLVGHRAVGTGYLHGRFAAVRLRPRP
jgi:hypothetical protein